ncbi:Ig-like domain-containing protein, partial [Pseudomonas granadensis]|uniref:Ig-like domain-containing protein n=1 Tax=Pseudomonas granadensis TaxID=1421430 RepID=UPI00300F18F8
SADGTAVTGTGEPGATVHIFNGAGTEIGTAIVAGNGSYTATLTTPQANGETVTVTQSDPAGNLSPATVAIAPDLTPPAPPAGLAINGAGTVVTGSGEAGASVEVRDTGGTLLGTGTVAANGSFSVSLNDPQT